MSTQPSGKGDGGVTLPDVVPFDLSALTRLHSDLGEVVVADDGSTLRGEWRHAASRWRLSVYDVTGDAVTGDAVVLRVRTPVGRRRFYGAARADFESVCPAIDGAEDWRQVQRSRG